MSTRVRTPIVQVNGPNVGVTSCVSTTPVVVVTVTTTTVVVASAVDPTPTETLPSKQKSQFHVFSRRVLEDKPGGESRISSTLYRGWICDHKG